MDVIKPGGYGPWFCGLLFNTNDSSKKNTHVTAHTYLELYVALMNKHLGRTPNREDVGWVVLLKVGPFTSWRKCMEFVYLWTEKTRGKAPRLARGLELYLLYGLSENLHISGLGVPLEEIKKQRHKKKRRKIAGKDSVIFLDARCQVITLEERIQLQLVQEKHTPNMLIKDIVLAK